MMRQDENPFKAPGEAISLNTPGFVFLITPEQLKQIPDGTILSDLDGKKVVKKGNNLSNSTRGGYIAYGFTSADIVPANIQLNPTAYVPFGWLRSETYGRKK